MSFEKDEQSSVTYEDVAFEENMYLKEMIV
jgi:hypothetical protein